MSVLLVVDDEPSIHHAFERGFRGRDVELCMATTSAEAVAITQQRNPDAIVLDLHLPDASGLETFHRLRGIDERIPIILITGHGTTELAIEAIKQGAFEYLLKPLELPQIRELVDSAIHSSRLMRQPANLPEDASHQPDTDRLIGQCPAMQDLYKSIGRVAAQDVTVLLLGESGTGKELVARAVYQHSHRAGKPFLAVNCAAIAETLLESELFGHEKSAFTGADRKHIGKFEQCHGGTIFLDEVGELSLATQAKMLRLLQEQAFERVGGQETIRTDVRVIAATNADLDGMSESGRFRRDLYFRLNVYALRLPPLRHRGDDLTHLITHFVQRFGVSLRKPVREITPDTWQALRGYAWPGNVRELQSTLKQAILQMQGAVLQRSNLPACVRNSVDADSGGAGHDDSANAEPLWDVFIDQAISSGSENIYAMSVERMERLLLMRVLNHTDGNQLQAARILGITRGSLRTKLRALGISIGRSVWSSDDQAG